MTIKHVTTYARPGNFVFPDPNDWNADHVFPPMSHVLNGTNITWTNMPLAAQELLNVVHRRIKLDLTNVAQVRFACRVSTVGVAAAVLYLEYSTDESVWNRLTANIAINTTGTKVTAWENIPAGAKADVVVRIMGSGGDGAADPIFGLMALQVR